MARATLVRWRGSSRAVNRYYKTPLKRCQHCGAKMQKHRKCRVCGDRIPSGRYGTYCSDECGFIDQRNTERAYERRRRKERMK
jgi:predicted nucleic acid-binding Zn ribbon protein